MNRRRQAVLLLRPLARTERWLPLPAAAAVAAGIVVFLTGHAYEGVGDHIAAARIAAVVIAVGAGFVLDDPIEEATGHVPTPLLLRRVLRVGIAVPWMAAAWWLGLSLIPASNDPPFPTGALTLEFATMVVVAVAASAAASRLISERTGGIAAGPILIGLATLALFLPDRFQLFASHRDQERWAGAHVLWWRILWVAVAAFAYWSLDRGRVGLPGRIRRLAGSRSRGRRTPPIPPLPSGTPVRSSAGRASP